MMNRLTITICTLILFITNIQAQSTSELKKEINGIKKDPAYLYSEATLPDKNDAMMSALEGLHNEAKKWGEKEKNSGKIDVFIIGDIETLAQKIELPRGNMFRAFAYAKKEDVLAISNGAGGNKSVVATKKTATSTSVAPRTATSKPATSTTTKPATTTTIPKAIQRMLPYKTYKPLAQMVLQLKEEGEIKSWARYTGNEGNIEEYAVVVYNSEGNIEAILSPGSERTNYLTGKSDSLDNYKGGGGTRGALIIKL